MALYARFDCSFPDDPKVVEAGDLAELVYFRCVLKCRENLTDGVIDRRLLTRWSAGIRGKATTHAQSLVNAGLWVEHERGWAMPEQVWRRWNPTAAEVQAKRDEEAERKRSYRDSVRRPADVPTGHQVASGVRDRQPEPKPELLLANVPKRAPSPKGNASAPRPRADIWSALAVQFGEPSTESERKNRGRQCRELADAGASGGDVIARCNEHAARRLSWTLTANALVTHWTELEPRQSQAHILNGVRMSREAMARQ